jgi:predicted AlkP superfamily phosphohydrolase/phosphomutase
MLTNPKRRLLVIGIDGATYHLLDPMIGRGLLPHLAALIRRGFRAGLRSTIPPNSAAAWATFMTGKNPGRHGILRFQATRPTDAVGTEFRPGAYTFLNSESIAGRRVWDVLGAAGKRVAVMNVPMTYPPRPLNGIMVTGLLTPPGAKDFTYPPELADSLEGYQIEQPLATMGYSGAADRELIRSSLAILEQQGETALRLFAREPWDFFFVCFTGTDRIQHRLWNHLERMKDEGAKRKDEGGRMKDEEEQDKSLSRENFDDIEFFRENLDRYYSLLDSTIGRLVETAGDQADCIILSDHGFGPAPQIAVYRRPLARRLGLEAGEGVGGFYSLRAWLERHGIVNGDRLRRLMAGAYLRRLLSCITRLVLRKEQQAWRSSRAYLVILHKYIGGIGINLPQSDPGYEPFRQSLMARLAEVREPDSGKPIVEAVWRREEIYRGPRIAVCPDVVFRLDVHYGLAHGESPGGRLVSPKSFRSEGIHRDEGILLLAGPDVVHAAPDKFFRIEDVTATSLHLLDTPIPTDMDGQVVLEALTSDYRDGHAVRFEHVAEESATATIAKARWHSVEDEEAVAEQLRHWGYLD